jgi:glucose/arabinose dehydrogenase
MRARLLLVASLSAAVAACVFGQPTDEEPSGESSAALSSCSAGTRPSSGYGTQPALGGQSFAQPIAMVPSPTDSSQFYVVEQKGVIRRASTNGTATVFVDMRTMISGSGEAGLLGFALHPKFPENGLVYFSYTKSSTTASSRLASVLAAHGRIAESAPSLCRAWH